MDEGELFFKPDCSLLLAGISVRIHLATINITIFYLTTFILVVMMLAYRHIPTMTNSHHGGFLSVMIMVGICQ